METRTVPLRTNVTRSEEIKIKEHAHKCGTTVSSLLRSLALQAMGIVEVVILPPKKEPKRKVGRPRKNKPA